MNIPDWFGVMEFYAVLGTIWFGIIMYFLTACVKVKQDLNVKKKIIDLKSWWSKRKEAKNMLS